VLAVICLLFARSFALSWPEFVGAVFVLLVTLHEARGPTWVDAAAREGFDSAEEIFRDTVIPSLDRLISTITNESTQAKNDAGEVEEEDEVVINEARYPGRLSKEIERIKLDYKRANYFLCHLGHFFPKEYEALLSSLN
jgi:hypothetical protein